MDSARSIAAQRRAGSSGLAAASATLCPSVICRTTSLGVPPEKGSVPAKQR
jgi:hypothetical protein